MSSPESEIPAYLHIFGQSYPHDYVSIAGNRPALSALRDAIEAALSKEDEDLPCACPADQSIDAFVNDGEGYVVLVSCRTDAAMQKTRTPY